MWQYCKDIPAVDNNNAIVNFNEANTTDLFNFKTKMTSQTGDDETKNVEIIVPLKYLNNFPRALGIPLINCEINLVLTWSENMVNMVNMIFKREVNWNNYLSKPELLAQNPNLNILVKPKFQGVNRIFVLAFESDTQRTSAKCYYLPNVELKDYNVMIDGKIYLINQQKI